MEGSLDLYHNDQAMAPVTCMLRVCTCSCAVIDCVSSFVLYGISSLNFIHSMIRYKWFHKRRRCVY